MNIAELDTNADDNFLSLRFPQSIRSLYWTFCESLKKTFCVRHFQSSQLMRAPEGIRLCAYAIVNSYCL